MACYYKQAEIWWTEIAKNWGIEAAEKLELDVWTVIADEIQPRIAKLLGIELPVKNMVEVAKIWQVTLDNSTPDWGDGKEISFASYKFDDDDHHLTLTVEKCGILNWIEKKQGRNRLPMGFQAAKDLGV
jgi:uncharacterized protein (DUF2267 family)